MQFKEYKLDEMCRWDLNRVVGILNLKSAIQCYLSKSELDESCRQAFESKMSNKMLFNQILVR